MRWPLLLPLLLLATPAYALKPGKHRSIAEAACRAASLPTDLCRRMGKAVYEVDYYEWEDLSAHAQTQRGQDRCDAANAAATRVESLARSVATTTDPERAAIDLGRAIHTIQDECAHHGMTNEQHAFLSLEQTCGDEDVSPDIQPEAIACATERTTAVMKIVAPALHRWGNSLEYLCTDRFSDHNNTDSCATAVLPTPVMACDFLALYKDWDGVDSTWNSAVVGSALLDAFSRGFRGEQSSTSVCMTDITPRAPYPMVGSATTCGLVDIGCLGKVDGDADVDPYGEEQPATGGCSTTSSSSSWLLLIISWVAARRSRGSSRRRSASRRP